MPGARTRQELESMGTPALQRPAANDLPAWDDAPKAPRGLTLENLESRFNLSTLVRAPIATAGITANVVGTRIYRIDAKLAQQNGNTSASTYTDTTQNQAQSYFNAFKTELQAPYVAPAPPPGSPSIPPVTTPQPTTTPVTITQTPRGSLTQLTITGTTGNDSIVVAQSGSTFTIVANGSTQTVTGNFAQLAIYGEAGDDSITVQASVNITTMLYGGSGNNTIVDLSPKKGYIVTIDSGTDNVTGNGINTSFWVNPSDTVNASATEKAGGDIHKVTGFYQPVTTTPGAAGYVSTTLDGSKLPDPTDSGTLVTMDNSLWGTGPTMSDVNQGSVGDCYFLAPLQSMALMQPAKLQELAVDLGDGTYAVQFQRNGTTSYVRVDGDLPAGYFDGLAYAHPTNGGPMWTAIMEKAYALFRTGANTYDSLNWGWTGTTFSDFGVGSFMFSSSNGATSIWTQLTTALAGKKAVAAITNGTIASSAPLIGSHAYSVVSTSIIGGVQYLTLRNPWGIDGAGNDSNPNDGLVQVTLAQFQANFSAGSISA
jgi:hypothetical protein